MTREHLGEPAGATTRDGGAAASGAPGRRTRTMGLPARHAEGPAPQPAAGAGDAGELAPAAALAPLFEFPDVPTEGMGGDPTLHPDTDRERNTLAGTEASAGERNPTVGGRPVDPANTGGHNWGQPYGDCHGVVAYRNVVPDATERARIAALHDGAQPGLDQFGLTVPFAGALAYQCVEFVTRYYRDALGHTGLGGGHAQTFLQGPRGGLEVHRFPTPTRPQAGDLVVMEGGLSPVGHVGIIANVTGSGDSFVCTVVQQNWGTASPNSQFTVTAQTEDIVVDGIPQKVTRYRTDSDWSGFRRRPGITPVAERGGATESRWVGAPDHGEGNYVVSPGATVYLETVARIYGLTIDDLRRFNPAIGDAVTAGSERVEIRVSATFTPAAPVIGRATITGDGATIRSGPGTSFGFPAANHYLGSGRSVEVYAVVDGGDDGAVQGFETRDWYRIAMFSGEDAYVFKGLCSQLA